MNRQHFNDRIEKKYEVGIRESDVGGFWRDLRSFLGPYGLAPVQEITSVSSVYFDNKDCDLLRYALLGRLMLVRLRTYETYGRPPEPISEYWVEVKTAADERRKKRRFPLTKSALIKFLEGRDAEERLFDHIEDGSERAIVRELYRESQETVITMGLRPILLVIYKRTAFESCVERLSIDWDVRYHDVTRSVLDYDSWKYLGEPPVGRANKVILEMKYLDGSLPSWFNELQRKYPIWPREYLKPVEGMRFLFHRPLKYHKKADFFLRIIDAYMTNSQPLKRIANL
jgi:hypothetical protein